ncbi:MAG: hypothetical protein HYZ40_11040 [Rhodospirillales bacterium]|nr:hypothetical protein [Rhodospirillales bacterium]
MPFIKEIWLKNTCEVLDAIADPNFLRDAWSGKSRYVSSPDEIYNNVFSDAVIDEYADPDLDLDEAQKAAGKAFIDSMQAFDSIGGPELPWQEVIDHPGWIEVREAAKFLDLLKPQA